MPPGPASPGPTGESGRYHLTRADKRVRFVRVRETQAPAYSHLSLSGLQVHSVTPSTRIPNPVVDLGAGMRQDNETHVTTFTHCPASFDLYWGGARGVQADTWAPSRKANRSCMRVGRAGLPGPHKGFCYEDREVGCPLLHACRAGWPTQTSQGVLGVPHGQNDPFKSMGRWMTSGPLKRGF